MRTVYCVFRLSWDYKHLEGIYSTYEKALNKKEELEQHQSKIEQNEKYWDTFNIVHYEVE